MTHNFRPIQPLGDRDVYYVTSFDEDNQLKDDSRLDDPIQDLTQTNSNIKPSIWEYTTIQTINNDNEIDQNPIFEQNHNDLVDTTTIGHRKFNKSSKNSANYCHMSTFWLIINCIILAKFSFSI